MFYFNYIQISWLFVRLFVFFATFSIIFTEIVFYI